MSEKTPYTDRTAAYARGHVRRVKAVDERFDFKKAVKARHRWIVFKKMLPTCSECGIAQFAAFDRPCKGGKR